MTECANDETRFQGDEPTPDQLRAAAHQALQALQKTQRRDPRTALDTEDDLHALRNAYRECERLAQRLGAPPNEDEREPPPWFRLAARNLTHGPESPDAAVRLAATIAVSTDGSPLTGTRYSANGSAAITWDQHQLRLDIRVQPHRMPTFDLQRVGKARHRGYVHQDAHMLRTALAEHRAEAQSLAHPRHTEQPPNNKRPKHHVPCDTIHQADHTATNQPGDRRDIRSSPRKPNHEDPPHHPSHRHHHSSHIQLHDT